MKKNLVCPVKRTKGSKISKERSRVTKRTPRHFEPNLKSKTFQTQVGSITITATNRVLRTINNKYENLEDFLLHSKNNKLTEFGKKLRRLMFKMTIH
jgi:ribosomal protein L28